MLLRREVDDDATAIQAVHAAAFARPDGVLPPEVRLVDALRDDGAVVPGLSIVAEIDDGVVGHVLCSRGHVEGRPALALGPLGVVPSRQRRGTGHALMHGVIAAADALDEPCVLLLGDVGYYARFGFRPAHSVGIRPPDPEWGEHFQLRCLSAWTGTLRGSFRYASAFDRIGP